MKLKASLLVVTCGEPEVLIKPSLESFQIFDEVVVLDMKGDPAVERIATSLSYKYEVIPRVPIVEKVRGRYLHKLTHNWIAFLDPDEVVRLSKNGVGDIVELLSNVDPDLHALTIKWIFHFKGKPLKGGYWRPGSKAFLLNKRHVIVSEVVHGGYKYDKSRELALSPSVGVLNHYWVYSIQSFLNKHIRYICAEKEKRVQNVSPKWSLRRIMKELLYKFSSDLIVKGGYKDGFLGLFLALFHVAYVVAPEIIYKFSLSKHVNNWK